VPITRLQAELREFAAQREWEPFRLCDVLGIDLERATLAKIQKNARKHPVEKARGNAAKSTDPGKEDQL